MYTLTLLLCVIIGYLVGSICSAVLVSRAFGLPDPCQEGSLNPGATNVLRLAGKKYALIVLIADVLKGFLPVVFARMLSHNDALIASFTALAAVSGHVFPIFFRFKGGKGVATALGALVGLNALLGLCVIATWIMMAGLFRYSSLSSIVSIALSPIFSLIIAGSASAITPLLLMTLLILYKHRTNIQRLIAGKEPTIAFKKKKTPDETKETLAEVIGKDTEKLNQDDANL